MTEENGNRIVRIAVALFLAIPGTLAAPFAVWLLIASLAQFTYHRWALSLIPVFVCVLALVALIIVWTYVIFGPSLFYRVLVCPKNNTIDPSDDSPP
jgi:hypothetical protein